MAMKISKFHFFACACLLASSMQVNAATEVFEDNAVYDKPDAPSVLLDSLVAKPIHATMVVGGFAAWLVSLPFAVVTDSHRDTWETLVVEPAEDFRRCLGCTEAQDQSKILNNYYERQQRVEYTDAKSKEDAQMREISIPQQ